jgi:hypothetical protein
MISLLKWAAFAAILGALVAHTSVLTKVFAVVCGLILLAVWLKSAVLRWLKSEGKAPAWDEISLVPPIMPEPPFTGRGAAYSWIGLLNGLFRTPRKATAITTIQWGNPSYDIGTKYTPRDPVEAMRWYKAAVDGDPIKATGPHYSKLRCRDV